MRTEIDLLVRASDPFANDVNLKTDVEERDWGLFLDSAFRHRVAALAGRALATAQTFEPESRHEYVQDALLAAYTLNSRRNRVLIKETARLAERFRAAGVAVAVRKGAFLAPVVYRDLGLRPMNDIDFFVERAAAKDAAAVLADEGYVPGAVDRAGDITRLTRRQEIFWSVHTNNLPTFLRAHDDPLQPTLAVDVCFNLFLPASGCDVPGEWLMADLTTHEVQGTTISAFRPEYFLLDVSAHLYKESTTLRYIEKGKHQRLLQYVDIVALVRCHPGLCWDLLLEIAKDAGAAKNVYYALAGAEALFPGAIPAEVLHALAREGGVDDKFLWQYGGIDLPQPLRWSAQTVSERLFSHERPQARSQSPV
ncbi:nucleotidyltransferase family protein [Streptomyces xanthochromogenes]|uniref:nucleotidyltransferase family protein n=1 Tax=Streptomyces xanthochromogenes TaxID=67384 RepID=UPI0034211A0B